MNSGKEIHVIVENVITDNASKTDNQASSIPTSDPKQPSTQANKTSSVGKAIIANAVNRAGQFGLSNFGNLTGDYQTQANIQAGLEIFGLTAMALTGPAGAVATIGTLVIKSANRQIGLVKKNQHVELLRQRTGMMNYSGGRI